MRTDEELRAETSLGEQDAAKLSPRESYGLPADVYRDERQYERVVEVPVNEPVPVEFVPSLWTAVQSGSWAILAAIIVVWLRYGNKITDYLSNQKEIQEQLVELHKDNQKHRQTTEERLTKAELSIERMLMVLTNGRNFGSNYFANSEARAFSEQNQNTGANERSFSQQRLQPNQTKDFSALDNPQANPEDYRLRNQQSVDDQGGSGGRH